MAFAQNILKVFESSGYFGELDPLKMSFLPSVDKN